MTVREIEDAFENPGNQEALRGAYAAARSSVAQMVQQNGRETVLLWLSTGLPAAVGGSPPQH